MTEDEETVTDLERWAAAAAWSRGDRLTPMETVLWRSERHPAQSSTSCTVILLDQAPDWDRFRAAHDWATRLVRRLRQRVLEPAVPTTSPVWVDDEHFVLDYHLRRQPVGGEATLDDVLEVAEKVAIAPFDRTRPLWEGVLVEGLDVEACGAGAAFILKIHHTLADGRGTVALLSLLQSRVREHIDDKLVAPDFSGSPGASDGVDLARQGVLESVQAVPERAGQVVRTSAFAARHPRMALASSVRYAASVRRMMSPPPADPSPLFADRDGRSWRFLGLTCSSDELRAAGRTAGGTLHDAFVATVLGGVGRYHEHHGLEIADVPVLLRVSLDRADDPTGGNRFAGAMIPGPAGLEDPADRIAAVRGELLSLHIERALDAFAVFAQVANRLPSDVGAAALRLGAAADVSVATLPGPTRPTYMAGAEVLAMFPFGPLPGVAVAASLLTYRGLACIGVNADGSVVTDPEVLRACLADSLDEVLALAR